MMLEGHSREDANASPFHNFANNLFSEKKNSQSKSHIYVHSDAVTIIVKII